MVGVEMFIVSANPQNLKTTGRTSWSFLPTPDTSFPELFEIS
jgi:hypothetical protein